MHPKPPQLLDGQDKHQAQGHGQQPIELLRTTELSTEITEDTLGTLLKYQDDIEKMNGEVTHGLVQRAVAEADMISA